MESIINQLPCKDCPSLAICLPTYKALKERKVLSSLILYILSDDCQPLLIFMDRVDKYNNENYSKNIINIEDYFDKLVIEYE